MIVTAWNNGNHYKTGAGYGVKISIVDRTKYFRKSWAYVEIEFAGTEHLIKVNIDKKSFWGNVCRELINKEIGK